MTSATDRFTEYRDKHKQECPYCNKWLSCTEDSVSGGSHYWTLVCIACNRTYHYDTYSYVLREWDPKNKQVIKGFSENGVELSKELEETSRPWVYALYKLLKRST